MRTSFLAFVLLAAVATPVVAASYTDPLCMQQAIAKRAGTMSQAYSMHGGTMQSAANSHGNAEIAAWNILDPRARESALQQAKRMFSDASSAADRAVRDTIRAARSTFKTESKSCKLSCQPRGSCDAVACPSGYFCSGIPNNYCYPVGCPRPPLR